MQNINKQWKQPCLYDTSRLDINNFTFNFRSQQPAYCNTILLLYAKCAAKMETKTLHNMAERNEREVLWILDEERGKSKTSLAVYIIQHFKNVAYLENTKSNDGLHSIHENVKIVLLDFSRSIHCDTIHYSWIETIKNGLFFTPKYESRFMLTKLMTKVDWKWRWTL